MQPIISPWLFYFIDILPRLNAMVALMFFLGLLGTGISLMIDDRVSCYDNGSSDWVLKTDPAKHKLRMKCLYSTGSVAVIGALGMLFIPEQDTVYKMLIASYITPDNLNAVVDGTGALVDRGVSYIGEISKSGLQTLMQTIVETARELKNL